MGFIEAGLQAYLANSEKFEQEFKQEYLEYQYIQGCICRGCAYSLDFSKYILSKNIFNYNIYKVAVSCLVMNNIIDESLIQQYMPFVIWYPFIPNKDTCFKLPESMKYSVAILSILMNWKDVFDSLNIENDAYIGKLIRYFNRDFNFNYNNTKNLVDLINEKVYSESASKEFYFFDILSIEIDNDEEFTILDYNAEKLTDFEYTYPFGLNTVSSWNIDKYIINKDIKYFMFRDEEKLKYIDYYKGNLNKYDY